MVSSTLLKQANKQKVAESLVQSDNQIKNATNNVVSLMNQVRNTYENNSEDAEITEACKEIYNSNLAVLRSELDKYVELQ